jgi:hypothetical protein
MTAAESSVEASVHDEEGCRREPLRGDRVERLADETHVAVGRNHHDGLRVGGSDTGRAPGYGDELLIVADVVVRVVGCEANTARTASGL